MRQYSLYTMAALIASASICLMERAYGQATYQWVTPGMGNWTNGANWSGGFAPEAPLNEVGIIQNGGTAIVTTAVATGPGGLTLGQFGGNTGRLEVHSGGVLNIAQGTDGVTAGALAVGQNQGSGSVEVQSGGQLTAHTITTNNVPFNPILNVPKSNIRVLGTGKLQATLDPESQGGNITIGGVLRVTGPSAMVSAANNFNVNAAGTYIADITGASHSVISVAGTATLNGSLQVNFSGVTPTLGSTWTLLDAGTVNNRFSSIAVTGGPTGPGRRYAVNVVSGGANGQLAQLTLTRVLVLQVNRDTGELKLLNPFGPAENVSGYSISSTSGALNAAAWNSLQDQAVSGWIQGSGSSTSLNELRNNSGGGFTSIGGAFLPSFGNVFSPAAPAQFGVTTATDVQFEYSIAGNQVVQGDVVYVGSNYNNLVLTVDPATGQAQLKNGSNFNISITNYSIKSEAGSLTAGAWSSLSDQSVSGWVEANPTANALSEVRSTGTQSLTANQSFNLGSPFTVGGAQDLTLEYLLAGESAPRTGVVVYGAASVSIPGDFNNNGVVNGADLAVWRSSFGATNGANADGDGDSDGNDFLIWQRNVGAGASTATAAAVPEATTGLLAAMGFTMAMAFGRVRRSAR
jgi:hypothetical protein